MKSIILIGFMATGKTSVGKRLARQLDVEFIDPGNRVKVRVPLGEE